MSKDSSSAGHHPAFGRRDVLWGAGGAAITTVAAFVTLPSRDDAPAGRQQVLSEFEETRRKLDEALRRELGRKKAQSILRAPAWTELDLNAFLAGLSESGLLSMRKALGVADPGGKPTSQEAKQHVSEIKKKLLRCSSNVLAYPFLDENNIQYHKVVKWVATESKLHEDITNSQSTFVVEHQLLKKVVLADVWDKLDQQQRIALLAKLDPNGSAKDHTALAALSGSAAITALSATAYFSGFAFYTSMSVVISTAAGWLGITLPFAAYAGASSLAAFLTGPVGWVVATMAAAVGVVLLGRANVKETFAAIVQIHLLKVAALEGVQPVPDDVFEVVGRVPK